MASWSAMRMITRSIPTTTPTMNASGNISLIFGGLLLGLEGGEESDAQGER